jgi:alkylhydroperoxidase family enzyme
MARFHFGQLRAIPEALLAASVGFDMAWIRQISNEEATGTLKKIFDDALRRAGRVWNIVRLTSLNPQNTRAHLGLYRSVMHQDSSLSPRMRETLAVVVSRANACHY